MNVKTFCDALKMIEDNERHTDPLCITVTASSEHGITSRGWEQESRLINNNTEWWLEQRPRPPPP